MDELQFLKTASPEIIKEILEVLKEHPSIVSIDVVWSDDLEKMAKASGGGYDHQ